MNEETFLTTPSSVIHFSFFNMEGFRTEYFCIVGIEYIFGIM